MMVARCPEPIAAAHRRRLPGRAAVVRLADEADATVGPRSLAEPFDRGVDAELLVEPHQVHAVVRLTGAEHRDLRNPIPMGDEVLDEEAAQSVGGCQRIDVPVAVVGADFGDDGNRAEGDAVSGEGVVGGERIPVAALDHREPQPEVHLRITARSCTAVAEHDVGHVDEHRAHRIHLPRPVP